MEKRLYQDHPKLAKIPLSMDERRAAMNLIAAGGPVYQAANAAYISVCDEIDARAFARKNKPKVYEIHHERAVAQDEFLREILSGGDIQSAANAARRAISLPVEFAAA